LFPLCVLVLLSACRGEEVGVGEEQGSITIKQVMPGGELRDPKYGKELWLAVGAMAGVEGTPANGVTDAHFFEDGTYVMGIQLNIERPSDGYFYEGWLVRENPKDTMSVGHLKSLFGDVRHFLKFKDERDLRAYTKVIVTLEVDDGNPAPARHVAEGVLKERTRS
jgi:hypothetical protein